MKKIWNELKAGKFFVCVCVALVLLAPQGCKKDPEQPSYTGINDWILEEMSIYYLWNTQIPRRTNKTLYPKDYFESLLYKAEDRFSWIQENFFELREYLSGITTEAGYEFNLFLTQDNNHLVYGYIAYIKPGTPAETAGLKRGDFFSSINGTAMTMSNYQSLLGQISKPHTIGKMILSSQGGFTGQTTNVSLSVIKYEENPILLDTIYRIESKKIGYFVYNLFARDSEEDGIAYELELNNLFGKYKAESIDELIIDLRYNSGGAVVTADALASMISNRGAKDVISYIQYNSFLDQYFTKEEGKDYNKSMFLDYIDDRVKINKLTNLERLHLIVTNRTASASEMIINCLRPYMEVVLVGDSTVGKNVGSISIYEREEAKQKTNTWAMQPIVAKFENAEHFSDYGKGFPPDVKVNELEIGMRQLGDIEELMLAAALDHIFGKKTTLQRKNTALNVKIVGSSIDRNPARRNMYISRPAVFAMPPCNTGE